VMASSGRLKPGEKGKIKVAVDLRGKMGNIVKTVQVSTNDPQRPRTTLILKMRVKDRIHMKKYGATEIFRGSCRGCHIERGKSKRGLDLFLSDCIMCHNAGRNALPLARMRAKPRKEIEKAIRKGVEKTSMPGWDARHGGPLTGEEIRGLIDYIKPVSRRSKN
jgi:hypothetical protein